MKNTLFAVAATFVLSSTFAFGDEYHPPFTCGASPCSEQPLQIPESVNNEYYFASVESRSHMDLEFVLVLKGSTHTFNTKIVGGMFARFDVKSQKDVNQICLNDTRSAQVTWLNDKIASESTTNGSSGFRSTYVVCVFDRGTSGPYSRLLKADIVSNSEVGD